MTDDDDKDPKVKTLVERDPSAPLDRFVDAATAAQLERWFGLPSFAQVEDGEVALAPPPEDEFKEVREKRRLLLEQVDMDLVDSIERRNIPRDILVFSPTLEPKESKKVTLVDTDYIEQRASIADERWFERPGDVVDALAESTPQALLRDLHRLETEFSRSWSNNDDDWMNPDRPEPEPYLVDIVKKIDAIMRVRYKMEPVETPDVASLLLPFREEVAKSWVAIANSGRLYNRRVTE
jgi:hypothetical protein